MDFDMDALFIESFFSEVVDIDYEFDAAKYYDFTRPETVFEAQEAERWFEITGYYPPSRKILSLILAVSDQSSFLKILWICLLLNLVS